MLAAISGPINRKRFIARAEANIRVLKLRRDEARKNYDRARMERHSQEACDLLHKLAQSYETAWDQAISACRQESVKFGIAADEVR